MFFLAHIDDEIMVPIVFADDHPFVHFPTR